MTTKWESALAEPLDQMLIRDSKTGYDLARPLYRCPVCRQEGEMSLHKYVDECPFFEDVAQAMLLTDEEKKAALRFCETCEDGEGHDVPKPMMKRLAELGLVVHKGAGWYEGTPALDQLQTESHGSN